MPCPRDFSKCESISLTGRLCFKQWLYVRRLNSPANDADSANAIVEFIAHLRPASLEPPLSEAFLPLVPLTSNMTEGMLCSALGLDRPDQIANGMFSPLRARLDFH